MHNRPPPKSVIMQQIKLTLNKAMVGRQIRYIPHSLNHRLHYMKRAKWNQVWKDNVWTSFISKKHGIPFELPIKKSAVTITLRTCRLLDVDNAYTCAKPILDGLRYAGVIQDDSPKHLSLYVNQEQVHKIDKQGVDIYLSEIK